MSGSSPQHSRRSFYNGNSSSSTSQLQNFASRSSLAGSTTSGGGAGAGAGAGSSGSPGFFDRHSFFGRNRPRTSGGVAVADVASSTAGNSHSHSHGNPSSPSRRPTSSRSASHNTGLYNAGGAEHTASPSRLGFPASDDPQDNNAGTGSSPSTGRRFLGMSSMARTGSSSGNAGNGSGNTFPTTPAAPPTPNTAGSDRSGSAFGRMFRRYSHGQGRANSNATDPNNLQPGVTLPPHSASSASFAPASAAPGARPATAVATQGDYAADGNSPGGGGSAGVAAAPSPLSAPANTAGASTAPTRSSPPVDPSAAAIEQPAVAPAGTNPSVQAGLHRIRLVPHLEATRSLHFEPIERDVREGAVAVKIGRFTDRHPPPAPSPVTATALHAAATAAVGLPAPPPPSSSSATATPSGTGPGNRGGAVPTSAGGGGRIDSTRVAFKSKVVSRGHAEIWCEPGGKFFIRDTKSSSGTFLNHIRLSAPNVESRPFAIKDGDILQLGVDYQGGTEEIYRCVKIRVELNRGWQREANQFNVNALRQLRALQGSPMATAAPATPAATGASSGKPSSEGSGGGVGGPVAASAATPSPLPTNRQSMNVTDCCICLFSVTVCQALFIAPCSHVFHYKCIRPLLNQHHPGFSCPLCRTFADLEADVEQDEAWQEALLKEAQALEYAAAGGGGDGSSSSNDANVTHGAIAGGASASRSNPTSSHGHGEHARGGTATGTPAHEIAGLDLPEDTTATATNVPSVASPLRQQVGRNAASRNALDVVAAVGSGRPGTAVGDGPPPGPAAFYSDAVNEEAIDVNDDEAEEILDDHSRAHSSGGLNSHEIDRISEEGDQRSETSMDGGNGNGGGTGAGVAMARRGSQPIAIGGASTGDTHTPRRVPSGSNASYAGLAGYSGFSPLEEARTPVNQHVLSVLAEAPPPNSMAARRFAEQQQQRRASASATNADQQRRPSAVPSEELAYATPGEGNSLSGHEGGGNGSTNDVARAHRSSSTFDPQDDDNSGNASGWAVNGGVYDDDGGPDTVRDSILRKTRHSSSGSASASASGSKDRQQYRRGERGVASAPASNDSSPSAGRSRSRSRDDGGGDTASGAGSKVKKLLFSAAGGGGGGGGSSASSGIGGNKER